MPTTERVTQKQIYQAITESERRLTDMLQKSFEATSVVAKQNATLIAELGAIVKCQGDDIERIDGAVDKLRNESRIWAAINSTLVAIATALGINRLS